MFCEDFVGEQNGDGGAQGFTIGKRDVCKACLSELKYRLSQVEAKSPTEREQRVSDDDEDTADNNEENTADTKEDTTSEEDSEEESNPFSAKAEI